MSTKNFLSVAPLLLSLWGLLVHIPLSVYLANQGELYFQTFLLLPGLLLFVLLCFFIWRVQSKFKTSRALARPLGFLIGFGILATHLFYVNNLAILNIVAWLNPALLLILFGDKLFLVSKRPVVSKVCASLFLAICLMDLGTFFTQTRSPSEKGYIKAEKANNERPNIYHVLFDMYQTDDWLPLVTPNRKESLSGFTLYENHLSVFDYTQFSVPALFSSRLPDSFDTVEAYQEAAYRAPNSLLGTLNHAGYRLEALNYRFPLPNDRSQTLFDDTLAANSIDPGMLFFDRIFYQLVFARTVKILVERPTQRLHGTPRVQWAGETKVAADLQAFEKYLETEALRKPTGRYSFLHVMLPHHPYILDENCRYRGPFQSTNRERQSECAAKLIDRFVARLKALGRYDNSTVLIHSDHGYLFPESAKNRLKKEFFGTKATDEELALISATSALLLYKPRLAKGALKRDKDWRTSLDIAPTLLGDLELNVPKHWEGQTLLEPSPPSRKIAVYRERKHGKSNYRFPKYRFQNKELWQERLVNLTQKKVPHHAKMTADGHDEHL